jgi:hypothetical protein
MTFLALRSKVLWAAPFTSCDSIKGTSFKSILKSLSCTPYEVVKWSPREAPSTGASKASECGIDAKQIEARPLHVAPVLVCQPRRARATKSLASLASDLICPVFELVFCPARGYDNQARRFFFRVVIPPPRHKNRSSLGHFQ